MEIEPLRAAETKLLSNLVAMQLEAAAREISTLRGYEKDDPKRDAILERCQDYIGMEYHRT